MKKLIAVVAVAVLMSPAAFAATAAPAHTQFFNRLLGQAVAKLPPHHHQPQPFVMQSRW